MFKWKIVEPKRRGKCKGRKNSGKKYWKNPERSRNITHYVVVELLERGNSRWLLLLRGERSAQKKFRVLLLESGSPHSRSAPDERTPVFVWQGNDYLGLGSLTFYHPDLRVGVWGGWGARLPEKKPKVQETHKNTLLHTKDLERVSKRTSWNCGVTNPYL